MSEETKEPTAELGNEMYIDAINELKQNTVSKEEYERVKKDNKKLLDALTAGKTIESDAAAPAKPSIEELRKNWKKPNQSNLEFWENTLALRDAVVKQGGKDPFLPFGQKISPTAEDVQKANNVAAVVRECIEYADGDSELFTNELQRRTIDVMPTKPRKK